MNKHTFKFLGLFALIILLGGCFSVPLANAASKLSLEVIKGCDIKYAGDGCVAELKLTNSTGKVLDGEATFSAQYQDEPFDGEGIHVLYNNATPTLAWNNGELVFLDFEISKGESQVNLNIQTNPALYSGEYNFALSIKGTYDDEEYVTPPIVLGGGGGTTMTSPAIRNETVQVTDTQQYSVTIEWMTSHFSTSQVIYGAENEAHTLDLTDNSGSPPTYGYENTTQEQDLSPKVTAHSVTIDGLDAGTTYHFRAISYASPPTISLAYTFTTLALGDGGEETGGGEEELPQEEVIEEEQGGATAGDEIIQGVLGEETVAGEIPEGAITDGGESTGEESEEEGIGEDDEDIESTEIMLGDAEQEKFPAEVGGFFPDWNWTDIIWIILIIIAILIVVFLVLKKKKKESKTL